MKLYKFFPIIFIITAGKKLMDSLQMENIKPIDFIKNKGEEIPKIYGILKPLNEGDFNFLAISSQSESELQEIMNSQEEYSGIDEWFYFFYAQLFEYRKHCDKALAYWLKNLEGNYERAQKYIMSLERTMELVYIKMNNLQKAFDLALKWRAYYP